MTSVEKLIDRIKKDLGYDVRDFVRTRRGRFQKESDYNSWSMWVYFNGMKSNNLCIASSETVKELLIADEIFIDENRSVPTMKIISCKYKN